ncbi:Uncharacterised protein [Mycobacterium tuberculosis]|nr:Uncharacterised protein [Mycobacterium tuberculosis]
MVFLMQNTGCRSHPLHIPFTDHTALTGGIVVSHLAIIDDGHGFKAAVRVLTNSPVGAF